MKGLVQNNDIYERATVLKQILLRSNNFFRTDTYSTMVLFQKRYFFTWRYDTYYYYCVIISLVLYLHAFQNSYFLEKANFSKSNIPHSLIFMEKHLFRVVKT